jgi:hypothetical protein
MIRHKLGTWWPDDWKVGWRRVRSASYTWCRREARGFFDLASKLVAMVCQWFSIKTIATIYWFEIQNQGWQFGDLGLKITMMISWLGPQNQGGGLSVCISKLMSGWRRCEDTRRHPAAYFIVKQVRLRFPSFASKLVKERWRVVHVVLSWGSRRSEAKDGWFHGVECATSEVRPNYPSLALVFILAHRGILVYYFWYK